MKRVNPNELTKAYTLPHSGNAGKIQALQQLYARYQQEYAFHLHNRWIRFLNGDSTTLSYIGSTKAIDTQLPSAILQGLLKCVTEHLKSYISSQQSLIRRVIHQSTLSASDKHQLHSLNWMTLWTHPHVKTVVLEKLYFQNPSLSKRLNQCLSYLRSQFVLQLAGRIRNGIVDLTLLRGILAKGVNKNRALIADRASLALLTEALNQLTG